MYKSKWKLCTALNMPEYEFSLTQIFSLYGKIRMIMFLYGEIRVRENPYSNIFYVVLLLLKDMLMSGHLMRKLNLKDECFTISIAINS